MLAVVAAEEGEASQVDAQGGEAVAVDAEEALEGGGELSVVGAGKPRRPWRTCVMMCG